MSSENFEESGEGEEAEVVERRELGEEEIIEAPIEEAPEAEDAKILYDVTRPELLETMMIASDILTQATLGQLSLREAKRLYEREVKNRMRKLAAGGVIVKKKPRARKAETKKKEEKAKAKARKEGKKKTGGRSRKVEKEGKTSST